MTEGAPTASRTAAPAAPPSLRARLAVACVAGVWAVALMRGFVAVTHRTTDFDLLWRGARYLLAGENPWTLIGPGRAWDWVSPLYYPGTALVAVAPLAALPLEWARALFVGISAALLSFAVTRRAWWPLLVLVSTPFLHAAGGAQWSPLVAAAFLLAPLGFVAVVKPTVGLATLAAAPTQRRQVLAAGVGAGLLAVSLALAPDWPVSWWAATREAPHMSAPVMHWRVGAPLVLLALLRWRRPEARWLVALACVPQSTLPYEGLYFMLFARSRAEMLALTVVSYLAAYAHVLVVRTATSTVDLQYTAGDALVLFFYLPALALVLRRPNEGPVPAWLEALARAGGGVGRRIARRRGASAVSR